MRPAKTALSLSFENVIPKLQGVPRSQIMVSFQYENADGNEVTVRSTKASTLYKDWYTECSLCPENDAYITCLHIHLPSCESIDVDHDLTFEELMFAIEKYAAGRDVGDE